MTDLSKIAKAFKNSKVVFTDEFWESQNKKIRENQLRFAEQSRKMLYNPYKCKEVSNKQ